MTPPYPMEQHLVNYIKMNNPACIYKLDGFGHDFIVPVTILKISVLLNLLLLSVCTMELTFYVVVISTH